MPHRIALTAALFALTVLAAACDGKTTDTAAPDDTPAVEAGQDAYSDADIAFLQGMVPHHAQAVEMAQLVPDRTDRAELDELARNIIASQEEEIAEMEQMLVDAGASSDEAGGHDEHDDEVDPMAGMMSQAAMEELAQLEDRDFELAFIDMMIEHHEGAIEAAEQILDGDGHPDVRQLAEDIIAEQEAEIAQMTSWREEWSEEAS